MPASILDKLCPVKKLSENADPSEYLFPDALGILDHWHILFNALKDGVEGLDWWPSFLEQLRAITSFLQRQSIGIDSKAHV